MLRRPPRVAERPNIAHKMVRLPLALLLLAVALPSQVRFLVALFPSHATLRNAGEDKAGRQEEEPSLCVPS